MPKLTFKTREALATYSKRCEIAWEIARDVRDNPDTFADDYNGWRGPWNPGERVNELDRLICALDAVTERDRPVFPAQTEIAPDLVAEAKCVLENAIGNEALQPGEVDLNV